MDKEWTLLLPFTNAHVYETILNEDNYIQKIETQSWWRDIIHLNERMVSWFGMKTHRMVRKSKASYLDSYLRY